MANQQVRYSCRFECAYRGGENDIDRIRNKHVESEKHYMEHIKPKQPSICDLLSRYAELRMSPARDLGLRAAAAHRLEEQIKQAITGKIRSILGRRTR